MADCKAVANVNFPLNESVSSGITWWHVPETVLTNKFYQCSGKKCNITVDVK